MISFAKSLAKSALRKQDKPLRAMPASYMFWLPKSLRIMFVVSISTSVPSWKLCDAAKYPIRLFLINLDLKIN